MPHRLTKHHGLGNDFLVLLTDDPAVAGDRSTWVERAPAWCHRHRGIGADGLLVGLHGGADADLVMTLVNADGSVAEMSGNGIRCLAQAEAMRRGEAEGTLSILTEGGPRSVTYRAEAPDDLTLVTASVDMGPARPGPHPDHPVPGAGRELGEESARRLALEAARSATYDLGNPHLVLLVAEPEHIDLRAAGPAHEAGFPQGINVHFVAPTPDEDDAMSMRVWERGAGVTEACGTGAVAVARAAHDWGLVGPRVTVHMPGGDVVVDVGDPMVLHGPSQYVATVEVSP
jgi:diaminopimelate epimerase